MPEPDRAPAHPTAERSERGLWRAVRNDPLVIVLLAAVLVIDTVYRQLLTSVPVFLRDAGAPTVAYGALMATNATIIVLFEAPLALGLRRRRALPVVASGFGLVGVGYLFLVTPPALVGATVAVVVISAGEMLYKPTATAHMADSAPAGMQARYQSLYAGVSISGMFLAPPLGGLAYEHVPQLIWPACGVLALATGLVLAVATNRRHSSMEPARVA